jgi:hypothetical protein
VVTGNFLLSIPIKYNYIITFSSSSKVVLNKQTLRVKKVGNSKMKVNFYHTAGRDNPEVMHIKKF